MVKNIFIVSMLFFVLIISTSNQIIRIPKEDSGEYLLDSVLIKDSIGYTDKWIYKYNENDNLVKYQKLFWDKESKIWKENGEPTEFIYKNNRLVSKKGLPFFTMTYFYYDENGNKSLETDSFSFIWKYDYDYKGNIISEIIYRGSNINEVREDEEYWREFFNEFLNEELQKSYEDENRKKVIETYDTFFIVSSKTKIDYLYNKKNALKTELLYDWDNEKKSWIKKHQTEYNYNRKGNLLSKKTESEFDYDSKKQKIVTRKKYDFVEYDYDKNNRKISKIQYWYDDKEEKENNWGRGEKIKFEYHNDLDTIPLTIYEYRRYFDEWEIERKTERIYGENKKQYIVQQENIKNPQYNWKGEFFYDENKNLALMIQYSFCPNSKEWKESSRYEYFYHKICENKK